MNFEKLKNSLVDTIAEQQLTIGYQKTVLQIFRLCPYFKNGT